MRSPEQRAKELKKDREELTRTLVHVSEAMAHNIIVQQQQRQATVVDKITAELVTKQGITDPEAVARVRETTRVMVDGMHKAVRLGTIHAH